MNPTDKATPCPIGKLPDELLVAIVSNLNIKRGPIVGREAEAGRQKENTSTVLGIHALTLTCRKLNAIATSSLYQCIVFSQAPMRMSKLLLRTLIERAELSRHIQYIESPECCLDWNKTGSPECGSPVSLTESDMALYGDHLSDLAWSIDPLDLSLCKLFSKELQFLSDVWGLLGRLQIASLCLIAIAQNLSQVVISPAWYHQSVFGCKRYCPINHLQTIWIYTPSSGPLHLRRYDVGSGFTNNQIKRLLDHTSPPIGSIEMDKVSLYGNHADDRILWHTLIPFTVLKHLEFRWHNIATLPSNSWPSHIRPWIYAFGIDLPAYRTVFLAWKNSLEVLTLDFLNAPYQLAVNEDIHAFGSFREFTSLKQLNVAGFVLFGDGIGFDYPRLSTILPESLESLSINTKWDEGLEDALTIFHEDLSAMPCQLRTLECSGEPAPKWIAEKLVAAFEKIGVKLVLSIEGIVESTQ